MGQKNVKYIIQRKRAPGKFNVGTMVCAGKKKGVEKKKKGNGALRVRPHPMLR